MVLKRKSKNVDASLNFRNDGGGGFPATDLGDEREQQDTHHSSRSSPSTKKL
jgi:hypothetical protein